MEIFQFVLPRQASVVQIHDLSTFIIRVFQPFLRTYWPPPPQLCGRIFPSVAERGEVCSFVQLLMMIVMMACPSLIRNSTPLIKGPGALVLMVAVPATPSVVGQQARGG